MKKITYLLTAFLILGISSCQCPKSSDQTTPNLIRTAIPERPAGQTDVIGLRCAPLDTVRVGFIGLGMRGPGAVYRFTQIEGTAIKALCDLYPERVEKAQEILTKNNRPQAAAYSGEEGWKQLCERPDIDLVYIVTPWLLHTPIAVYAMEHGKHVAIEVPAAMNLDECWQLINTSEKTRKHCMMLENCVYDFFELTTLNMAQHGLFGDILHVEGSYIHNLEEFWAAYQGNWRLDFNEKYRGDVYATHGMGPACQLLDIHRGNKMNYLVSMDTKALTGPKLVEKINKRDGKDFQNGDHTMTMITAELCGSLAGLDDVGPFGHLALEADALADFGAFDSAVAFFFELAADFLHFLSHIHLPFDCGGAHFTPSLFLYIKSIYSKKKHSA